MSTIPQQVEAKRQEIAGIILEEAMSSPQKFAAFCHDIHDEIGKGLQGKQIFYFVFKTRSGYKGRLVHMDEHDPLTDVIIVTAATARDTYELAEQRILEIAKGLGVEPMMMD